MKIVADENIPRVKEAFAQFGEVHTFAGRQLQPSHLAGAEILLVRSVTPVGADLLANSKIGFVASATIGVDHIDRDYLQSQGIAFANAPGCNANSVAEYVLSAMVTVARSQQIDWRARCVGLIGYGNVGHAVKKRMDVLGIRCLVNDPPLQDRGTPGDFVDLATVLQADVVSLHVPLSVSGPHPTRNMVNQHFLQQMRSDALLINTSRGDIMAPNALEEASQAGWSPLLALDVWRNEPNINLALMDRCALSTPHIAGYSLDGKVGGTAMIYQAACQHYNEAAQWTPEASMPAPKHPYWQADPALGVRHNLENAILSGYDIAEDDEALRKIAQQPSDARAGYFDGLRKHYRARREYKAIAVEVAEGCGELAGLLAGLGFE